MSQTKQSAPLTDARLEQQEIAVGAMLKQEQKVRIKIPQDRKNPANRVVPVAVNGYLYYINRGETVEVPRTVAEILTQAEYI